MNNKKNRMILLTILMAFLMAMMMTACGSDDPEGDTSDDAQSQAAAGGFEVRVADVTFSDDKTKMTVMLGFNNQTGDAIVPAKTIAVKAVQDGEELTFPDESLDGPALGGTETQYEMDYDLSSQSPVEFTVTSLGDNSDLLNQEIKVE